MAGMPGTRVLRLVLAATVTLGLAGVVVPAKAADGPSTERFSIGASVRGRPITVVHRSWPGATRRVLVIGSIHGDERAGLRVIHDLRGRGLPRSLDLWLVRTANPDGVVADRRTNAHRVDLNRNFPYRWRSINRGTETWSGPAPLSEPESRALRRLVRRVHPQLVVIFHQPLFGVGANDRGMRVVRALARGTGLPVKSFNCTGVCHGSFSSWVNHRTRGLALTVEFGRRAADTRVRRVARAVVAVGTHYLR